MSGKNLQLNPAYATIALPRPLVAVDVVVLAMHSDVLSAVLIRRALPPFQGKWAIPGGFVLPTETLEAAALRELREETGLRVRAAFLEQLYTFGALRRDPRGRVISVTYLALVDASAHAPHGGSDAAEARWWAMDQLPPLAFDHAEILTYALQRLRYKLEYTNIAYALLPERFTFGELQHVYELAMGKEIDKRNFRKKMMTLTFVRQTHEWKRSEHGRPARLWQFVERSPVMVKTFVTKAKS